MATITIQPKEGADFKLPSPFHIDVQSLEVGRQDFWQGKPAKLIAFASTEDHHTLALTTSDFIDEPARCVGLLPIMENADGTWHTWTTPIESATAKS